MADKRLFRLVHDVHVIGLEGHHYTMRQIIRCVDNGVFLPGTIFRENKNLWRLTKTGLEPVTPDDMRRGVSPRLRQSRLSLEEIALIRRRLRNKEHISTIAREFRISPTYVYKIGKGTQR